MLRFDAPPIPRDLFVAQTYDDDEYWRERKPDGTLYSARDEQTGRGAHCGFDLQGPEGCALYAVSAGITRRADFGATLGIQTVLVRADGTGVLYAHQHRRVAGDGTSVAPGEPIGVMGRSGGVPLHLHLAMLRRWNDFRTLINPGPALRDLKEALMPLNAEDLAKIKEICREEASRTSQNAAWSVLYALAGRRPEWLAADRWDVVAGVMSKVLLEAIQARGESAQDEDVIRAAVRQAIAESEDQLVEACKRAMREGTAA